MTVSALRQKKNRVCIIIISEVGQYRRTFGSRLVVLA